MSRQTESTASLTCFLRDDLSASKKKKEFLTEENRLDPLENPSGIFYEVIYYI